MKIKSRKSLSLTGLKYNADVQDFQTRCYSVITETGDLKYNLIYELAATGRIKLDGKLVGLIRTLITEIRMRDEEIEELEATNNGLREELREIEEQIGQERQAMKRRKESFGAFADDVLDEDGRIPGYYGT